MKVLLTAGNHRRVRAVSPGGGMVEEIMGAKGNGTPTTRRGRRMCKHQPRYETDWLGRTYVGCPVCGRWKPVKRQAPPPETKRLAA